MDARFRCLTWEQLQELATLHSRPLASDCPTPNSVLPAAFAAASPVLPQPQLFSPTSSEPQESEKEAPLLNQLAALEAQVTLLQEQVTQLTQELLQERQLRSEQCLATLEELLRPLRGVDLTLQTLQQTPEAKPKHSSKPPSPKPAKSRSHALSPLVEYTADGSYMILSPTDGELAFSPNSPQWFAWLSTLTSLRFVGQQGSFCLRRRSGQQSWQARRVINGRRYDRRMGRTEDLTSAALEQMALTFLSSVPSTH